MKAIVEELRILSSDLDTMVYILSGGFKQTQLDGNKTIKEQVDCYRSIGTEIQILVDEIFKEHGNETNPSSN